MDVGSAKIAATAISAKPTAPPRKSFSRNAKKERNCRRTETRTKRAGAKMQDYSKLQEALIERGESDLSALADAFELVREREDHQANAQIRNYAVSHLLSGGGTDALDLYKKTLLFDARVNFDSFLLYTEWNRPDEKKFYLPRRKQLKQVVDAMQLLYERKLELLCVSMPPGTGKSTLALFFITWLAGKHPEKPILTGSHANSFLRGAYDECIRMMDPNGEYLWQDVFPAQHIIKTNAQDMLIDVGENALKDAKRFPTLEFSSIGSGNAGKVRAEQLLFCDDLVDGIETAMSRDRLDKIWMQYTTDLRQRKIGDAVELIIATRWSVSDVIGRLENHYDGGSARSEKAKFIVMSALDENGESNFDYKFPIDSYHEQRIDAGFTTEFYHKQREVMDDASWRALFMNEPVEREGQLYPQERLRRYFSLPDREPDAIVAVCDTKDRGSDYCVLPIAYKYGDDYYIESVVCSNHRPEIVETRLVMEIVKHKVQTCQFESNSAGGKVAEKVQSQVKEKGGRARITTKWTQANKETKILMNSPWVIEHCLFKDDSVIKDNEYRAFLRLLCSYSMAGRNKYDDVPDAMAQLALFCQNLSTSSVRIFRSPF